MAPSIARPALDPLEAYRLRGVVTRAELALLELVRRLSLRSGSCYMGNARLAAELGVNPRTVRKLKAALVDKGLLAIVRRSNGRGNGNGTSLMRVCQERLSGACAQPVANAAGGGPEGPGGEALKGLPRGGPKGPPKNIHYQRYRPEPAAGGKDDPGPLFRRTRFNPFDYRPRERLYNDSLADRLAHAFKLRMFLFVEHEGRVRTIDRVAPRDAGVYLFLIDESAPDAEPQRVAVPNTELGSWKFWR